MARLALAFVAICLALFQACSNANLNGDAAKGGTKSEDEEKEKEKDKGGKSGKSGASDEPQKVVPGAPNKLDVPAGGSTTVDLGDDPKLEKLTWTSSDPSIATVSEDGKTVTGIAEGSVTIKGTDANGEVVVEIEVKVSKPATTADCKPTKKPSATTLVHRIQKSGVPNATPLFAYTTEAAAVVSYAGASWNNNGPAFKAFGQDIANLAQVFICAATEPTYGGYQFLSLDKNCEGVPAAATPWVTIKSQQDDPRLIPIYRCNVASRLCSTATSECTSAGGTATQFGWVFPANGPDTIDVDVPCTPALPAITLVYRIQKAGLPANAPAFAYTTESSAKVSYANAVWDNNGPAFKAFGQNVPNTAQAFLCEHTVDVLGTYQFLSLDSKCEGTTARAIPWVTIKTQQDDAKLVPIYRCNVGSRMSTTAQSECSGLGGTATQFGWVLPI